MTVTTLAHPSKHRFRIRLSVRGLTILTLVLGAGLGWIIRPARMQRNAVRAIERLGGNVTYDLSPVELPVGGQPRPRGGEERKPLWLWPRWLVASLGPDFFADVYEVRLQEEGSDETLAHIVPLKHLQYLYLEKSQVTDAGLAHLRGLTEIQFLQLGYTGNTNTGTYTWITDAGMAHLGGLTNLHGLMLGHTGITDDGLAHLKDLETLYTLYLGGTGITDAGLAHIRELAALHNLYLPDTPITGSGLAYLKGMRIRFLDLHKSQVNDAALAHLRGLPSLGCVSLSETDISDAGLEHLQGWPLSEEWPDGLRLWIARTKVTDAGLAHLEGVRLRVLDLSHTQITDAGIAHLAGTMHHLEQLKLRGTSITDASLIHLKNLSRSVELDLVGTKLTEEGVEELRQGRPAANIRY
jgi:internalin A